MAEAETTNNVWYLARDGQQYGPLTDLELTKLIELGHLRDTDLVWNPTLPEWKPASVAVAALAPRPAPAAPMPSPAAQPRPQPQPYQAQPSQPQPVAVDPVVRSQPAGPVRGAAPETAARQTATMPSQYTTPAGAPIGGATGRDMGSVRSGDATAMRSDPHGFTGGSSLPQPHERASRSGDDDEDDHETEPRSRGGRLFKVLATVLALAGLGAGGWFAFDNQDMIHQMIMGSGQSSAEAPVVRAERSDAVKTRATQTQSIAPGSASSGSQRVAIMESELWQKIAKVFPEWEAQKREDVAAMQRNGADAAAIGGALVQEIAKLRRQHATEALAASPNTLRSVASAFLANLRTMAAMDSEICYAFISSGESSAKVLPLLADNAAGESIHKQLRLIVDAIVDGRANPTTYLPPRRSEYSMISEELTKMGWTNEDVRIFGDPQALSKAPAPKVCQLVTDWFTAQLMVNDPAIQARLLVQSLRPVLGG